MIAVDGLVYRYGDTAAVDGASLTLADGEFVALAGPNGCGKTTLVSHFNALLTPDGGTVRIDGHDVTENPVLARTRVGMVFQEPRDQFVSATVGADVAFGPENLGLDREEIARRVADALAVVNMTGRESDRIETLSGGEAARLAIAGALAMEPDYLVLDEPFVGLDLAARESVLAHLDELSTAGTGIVVVTHDLRDLLDRADRLLVMDDGRIVADADPTNAPSALEGIAVRVPEC